MLARTPMVFSNTLDGDCNMIFRDYQIRHLGNLPGLPEMLLKINPWVRYIKTQDSIIKMEFQITELSNECFGLRNRC